MGPFDNYKALAAILYLSNALVRDAELLRLVKLMYLADRRYLNLRGTTITNDFFMFIDARNVVGAMTYDMLGEAAGMRTEHRWFKRFVKDYLRVENGSLDSLQRVIPLKQPDLDELSPLSLQILDAILSDYLGKDLEYVMNESEEKLRQLIGERGQLVTYEQMTEDAGALAYLRWQRDVVPPPAGERFHE
ncbi:MAG: hypothetical protein ACLP5H_08865 [Desulfomonilaceae bacterium]